MQDLPISIIITVIALVVIMLLLFVIYISFGISRELKIENEDKEYKIEMLKREVKHLEFKRNG
jgi:uncharacterized membrane protein